MAIRYFTATSLFLLALLFPILSFAQATDLNATVRAALASDPRTAGMSPAQIDAMAQILSGEASRQGITPQDITWRPIPTQGGAALLPSCGAFPTYFCTINHSFGFDGSDPTIPIWLEACSLMLIFLFAEMRAVHRRSASILHATAQ
jgi:hypothetical protein